MSLFSIVRQIFGFKTTETIELSARQAFYDNKTIDHVEWWLSYCSEYPELYWARIRVLSDGCADAAFDENTVYGFDSHTCAANFVSEDEYLILESFDDEQRRQIGAEGIEICPPNWGELDFKFEYLSHH